MELGLKNMNNILELKDISISFEGEQILDKLNLYIRDREFVTFFGPSGCGKTTTLRIIAGFLKPDSGEVFFENKNITNDPPHKRNVNTVFQRYALFPHLNVFENIAFGLKIKKMPKNEIKERVSRLLKVVNLEGFERRRPFQLSGGQQQRIAIARALVNRPKILLLDEPLCALDLKLRKQMQLELKEMQQSLDTAFIYVTHDQEEALTMSDTVVVMNEGEIQQIGTPEQIYNEPKNAFVADFIGQSNILNGVMLKDYRVYFAKKEFDCVDKGFKPGQPVDVVIRPEDLQIVPKDSNGAKFVGKIDSVVFKGVHYEMEVYAQNMYWLVQTTKHLKKGEEIGLNFSPDDIHIMSKLFDQMTNIMMATVIDEDTIKFLDVEFKRVFLNLDVGCQVKLTIPPESIHLVSSDFADLVLPLDSIIYKGAYNEMYFYYEDEEENDKYILVHSENEEEVGTELGLKFDFSQVEVEKFE